MYQGIQLVGKNKKIAARSEIRVTCYGFSFSTSSSGAVRFFFFEPFFLVDFLESFFETFGGTTRLPFVILLML